MSSTEEHRPVEVVGEEEEMGAMSRMLKVIHGESELRGVRCEVKKKRGDGAYVPVEEEDVKMADFDMKLKQTLEGVKTLPLAQRAKFAAAMREVGNERYQAKDYQAAVENYAQSMCGLEGSDGKRAVALPVLTNMAVCFLELRRPKQALACCDEALAIDPASAKAHFRRGKALFALDRYSEARAALDRARALSTRDPLVRHETRKLCDVADRVKQTRAEQRRTIGGALADGALYDDVPTVTSRRAKLRAKQPTNQNKENVSLLETLGLLAWLAALVAVASLLLV